MGSRMGHGKLPQEKKNLLVMFKAVILDWKIDPLFV